MPSPGYIYFAQPAPMPERVRGEYPRSGHRIRYVLERQASRAEVVKIGFTAYGSPRPRLKDLGRDIDAAMVFLGAFRGLPLDERRLHERFRNLRAEVPVHWPSRSEWFLPGDELLSFIEALPAVFRPGSVEFRGPKHLRWRTARAA